MPVLDFANPVKTFNASDTYTAQDGDYLYNSCLQAQDNGVCSISVDGHAAFKANTYNSGITASNGWLKLAAGQVVTTSTNYLSTNEVFILREL